MILYNITINIDVEKEVEFVDWMKKIHMPKMMATGLFSECRFFKLLQEPGEGVNYSSQFYCENLEKIQIYQDNYSNFIWAELKEKFGNHYVTFRSLLETVD